MTANLLEQDSAKDRRRLHATQALLLMFGLVLALVGRRPDFWPLATWPVYAQLRPVAPASTLSALEVRVPTKGGGVVNLRRQDLAERSRHLIGDRALSGWSGDRAKREYLTQLVRRQVGLEFDAEADALEIWQLTWRVDPESVPAFDIGAPVSRERLGVIGPDSGGPR